jgi:hypothetical protein
MKTFIRTRSTSLSMTAYVDVGPSQKDLYRVELIPEDNLPEDLVHLGYFKVSDL